MNAIVDLFRTEPTIVIGAIGGLVDALIVLGVTFGLPLNPDQAHAIDAVVLAGGALGTLIVIRSQVTPVAKLPTTTPTVVPSPPTP